ncbi:MAG: hypothetical protein E7280_04705 [Lachnospiraceae bacterium]|nr:hypothetical protein [Lachnospiraceae bacterium]
MDRYEYKLKLDEIRKNLSEGKISEAVAIVDGINWKKVRMVSALCLAGEVYEKAGRYEESKDLYLEAYERSPIGKTIIYRLALVAVKSGNMEEAEDYYNEFVEFSPTDNIRYILKYQIQRAKGAPVEELIHILQEYKEREGSERWSYELAALYHRAGKADLCVELCDEIILWYGDGKFVEKALELKMLYQPLSPEQEKTFRKIKQKKSGVVEVTPDEDLLSGEILSGPKVIPEVKTPSPTFNTVNLQQELANNMKSIMEATKKETVSTHMEQIKELVNTIPYLKMPEENPEETEDDKYGHIATDEEIDGHLKIDFQGLLGEEQGGQMSLNVPEQPTFEKQITGQMSIEEVLMEWEKTKQAAQAAMEMAEQKKLESAKARALKEAEGIMDRLNDVIPQLEAGKTPRDLMEEEYTRKMEADAVNGIEVELEEEPQDEMQIPVEETQPDQSAVEEAQPDQMSETPQEAEDAVTAAEAQLSADVAATMAEMPEEPKEISVQGIADRIKEAEQKADEEPVAEAAEEAPEEPEKRRITSLTAEQKEQFAYFLKVDGMEKQLCKAMDMILHKECTMNSTDGNLLIEGGRGSGKTELAVKIIKALRAEGTDTKQTVGKIKAEALNKKNVLELLGKVSGGFLIIEKAGELNKETAEGLALGLEGNTDGLTVIMEDTAEGLQNALMQSSSLASKFGFKITIPVFTIDELVQFAKSYAVEKGYEIEEIAILALYNRISKIQKIDRATYVAEVKELLDQAMEKASRGGLKKAFMKKKTDDGRIIIHEKDFQ